MKKICIIILPLYCVLSGCHKKEHYEVTSAINSPVFHVSGSVDGKPVLLQAGINNYYMFASHQLDSDSVYLYTGTLEEVNCSTCGPKFQIGIRAYRPVGALPLSIDSSLRVNGNYDFQDESLKYFYEASFQGSSLPGLATNYLWDFGGGKTGTGKTIKNIYKKPGKYQVCLTVTGNNSCQSSICNTEIISDPQLRTTINTLSQGDSIVPFTQTTQGQGPFRYLWSFGQYGKSDTSNLPAPTKFYPKNNMYNVILRVIDANNDTIFASYNISTGNSCAANYTLNVVPIRNIALGEVNLTWTDAQGNVYNSAAGPQVSGAYFKILSVEDYTPNEKGERSKKLHVQFSGRFYKGSQYITLDNMDAVIAVSYP